MEHDEARQPEELPRGLTTTVGVVGAILGDVIREAEGQALFAIVEDIRHEMVVFRDASDPGDRAAALARAESQLRGLSLDDQVRVARAYTLYLELVNVCENAYRTDRLRRRALDRLGSPTARLTLVMTAHPTESRSPENIRLLRRAQDLLAAGLAEGRPVDAVALSNLLHLAWRLGTHPGRKPTVEDEASHLFSLLTDPIVAELIDLNEAGHEVLLRTWVGGDKDGHPGVGAPQMLASLDLSRKRLLGYVENDLLGRIREDTMLCRNREIAAALAELEACLNELCEVGDGDGGRIEALHRALDHFRSSYQAQIGAVQPQAARLATLLRIFPALVVPLELREERGQFAENAPIAAMLRRLAALAEGGQIAGYALGCVVSMTCEARDLLEAHRLVVTIFGSPAIPIIPLFELPEVLERAPAILRGAARDDGYRRALLDRGWVEVMLGYSDTAKRMGMLASRVGVHRSMREIADWAQSEGLTPVFFHGHGGSVGRGGGRIEDLAATWPPAARAPYKYTLQGEMVERTLATPEILRSLVVKVAKVQADPPRYRGVSAWSERLAAASQQAFSDMVTSRDFLELLARATPYRRLHALTIGSRPTRRGGADEPAGLEKLRAIPWVLCWTQTRLLLHAWLGIGKAWADDDDAEAGERLAEARRSDPLFRSYLRLLAFTLAKTSPELWKRYRKALAPDAPASLIAELERDYQAAMDLACRATGDGLLPDRPWLAASIHYRAPMIHPLNMMQIALLEKEHWSDEETHLFRETVTGIAAGMLTTG